jgi:soluble lytic murein transglycosylase
MVPTLVSCRAEQVLTLSKGEAAERLKTGDIGFILEADPQRMDEVRKLHPSAPFYGGLLVQAAARSLTREEGEGHVRKAQALFEAALQSPSPQVRTAAAQELLSPLLAGTSEAKRLARRIIASMPPEESSSVERVRKEPMEPLKTLGTRGTERTLYGAALYALGRFDEARDLLQGQKDGSSWDEAVLLLSRLYLQEAQVKGEVLDFLLGRTVDAPATWVFQELQNRKPVLLGPPESAAIAGRLSVSRSAYGEGHRHFQRVLQEEPLLFFQYPELTGDLGRSFQYAGSHEAGIALFLAWDALLAGQDPAEVGEIRISPQDLAVVDVSSLRYRLRYFAGRMERQRGRYDRSLGYFQSALDFAPDPLQADACIWYILHTAVTYSPENVPALLDTYIPRWHEDRYFADILDLWCRALTANRQWDALLQVFSQIRFRSDQATTAKYAYIIGRAVAEAYISPDQGAAALGVQGMTGLTGDLKTRVSRTFFTIALEAEAASFYYRAMSAWQLGDRDLPLPERTLPRPRPGFTDAPSGGGLEFLLGFFEFGAGEFAFSYLQWMMADFSIGELRILAHLLLDGAYWEQTIRLITAYMDRESYVLDYEDLLLYYPRPFKEIIEANAQEVGIPAELLYALIRTESAFNPDIASHAGAVGLSQLMADTAAEVAGWIRKAGGPDYLGDQSPDLRDPGANVHIGASYLRYLLDRLESPLQALLAYNGGMNRVKRWRSAEPRLPEDLFLETVSITETRTYGKRVLAAAAAYGYVYFDRPMEAVVRDMYKGLE